MKNTWSFVILLFSIVFAMESCKPGNGGTVSSKTSSDSTSETKIVYIDIDTLIGKYQLYLDKKQELEQESKNAEQALTGKIEAFQRRVGKFQQELTDIQKRANTIAPVELRKMEETYAKRQEGLAREEESLMKQRDNAALELDKKLQETQKDITKKIDEYLKKKSEEKGYDFVLMKGAGGSVMYGRNMLDITQETLKELNEAYNAEAKK
jgi:outer membrane protein